MYNNGFCYILAFIGMVVLFIGCRDLSDDGSQSRSEIVTPNSSLLINSFPATVNMMTGNCAMLINFSTTITFLNVIDPYNYSEQGEAKNNIKIVMEVFSPQYSKRFELNTHEYPQVYSLEDGSLISVTLKSISVIDGKCQATILINKGKRL